MSHSDTTRHFPTTHAWEARRTHPAILHYKMSPSLPPSCDGIRTASPNELLVQPDHRELRLGELRHRRLRVHRELDPIALRQRVRDVYREEPVSVGLF